MSEFKFACPVCGQHIKCDSAKSGTQLDCPTCFQELIVPHAPEGDVSKLILNATLASSRRFVPNDTKAQATGNGTSSKGKLPVAAIALVVLACAAGAFFAFRGKLFKGSSQSATGTNSTNASSSSNAPLANDTNWTLNLASVTIPDRRVAGRINGRVFDNPRVLVKGGALTFRQGPGVPPDLGLTINLFAKEGWELANQPINIETNRDKAPTVLLRWKDEQGLSRRTNYYRGYALRLEFGPLSGNHLTGKIYFCAPDEAKSYVAGTFDAEILKSSPPKPKVPKKPKPVR